MRIAIFDDNESDRNHIVSLVRKWDAETKPSLNTVHTFATVSSLLAEISEGHFYDLYFLDIMTEQAHDAGFRLAENIRLKDIRAAIIFTTNSPEYMSSAFEISAFRYLVKPVREEKIHEILDSLSKSIPHLKARAAEFQSLGEKLVIPYADIVYLESLSLQHRAAVHLVNGSTKEISLSAIPFSSLTENLLPEDFCQCHRGYIINLCHLTGYGKDFVTLCDTITVPISRERKNDFIAQLINYHKGMI